MNERTCNIVGIDSIIVYVKKINECTLPSVEGQKFKDIGELSSSWNTFVHFESARAAAQLGYGLHPLAFLNDILYGN